MDQSVRNKLHEVRRKVNDLWGDVLCHSPGINTNELLQEHMMVRETLLEINAMQNCEKKMVDTINDGLKGLVCVSLCAVGEGLY